jgi:Protein of unknown function (DUF1441)
MTKVSSSPGPGEPGGWSSNQLSQALGVDRRTVSKRLMGVKPSGRRRGHDVYELGVAARAILCPHTSTGEPASMSPREAFMFWKAEREHDKLELERGELLRATDVRAEWAGVIKAIVASWETLGDVLERDAAISPSAVSRVRDIVDRIRQELYLTLTAPDEAK